MGSSDVATSPPAGTASPSNKVPWAPPFVWQPGSATSPPSFAGVLGWGPLRLHTPLDEVACALVSANVAFRKETLKAGAEYFTLADLSPHGWTGTLYFGHEGPRPLIQILLISGRFATGAEAEAVVEDHVRRFGPPAATKAGYRDALREDHDFVWRNRAAELVVTVSHDRFSDLASKRSLLPEDASEQLDHWIVSANYGLLH